MQFEELIHTPCIQGGDLARVLVSYLLMSQEMKRVDCKGSFLFSLCKEKCVRWLIIFFKDRPRRLKQWGQTFFEAEFESSLSYQLSQYGYRLQFKAKIRKYILILRENGY